MRKLLCILGEGETGLFRTWCTGSRADVVGCVARADGGEQQEGQQGRHDKAL